MRRSHQVRERGGLDVAEIGIVGEPLVLDDTRQQGRRFQYRDDTRDLVRVGKGVRELALRAQGARPLGVQQNGDGARIPGNQVRLDIVSEHDAENDAEHDDMHAAEQQPEQRADIEALGLLVQGRVMRAGFRAGLGVVHIISAIIMEFGFMQFYVTRFGRGAFTGNGRVAARSASAAMGSDKSGRRAMSGL